MAEMGRYCKAYHVRDLCQFNGWNPNLDSLHPDTEIVNGEEVQRPRTELRDEDVLYVQESYVVTDGIFLDENVVFDAVDEEWKVFCRTVLGFEVPAETAPAEAAS